MKIFAILSFIISGVGYSDSYQCNINVKNSELQEEVLRGLYTLEREQNETDDYRFWSWSNENLKVRISESDVLNMMSLEVTYLDLTSNFFYAKPENEISSGFQVGYQGLLAANTSTSIICNKLVH